MVMLSLADKTSGEADLAELGWWEVCGQRTAEGAEDA